MPSIHSFRSKASRPEEIQNPTGRSQTVLFLPTRSSFKDMLFQIILIPSVQLVCSTIFEFEYLSAYLYF